MNKNEIKEEIKKLIAEQLKLKEIDDNEMLFGVAGGFDSMNLLSFIVDLEGYFDIVIADEDLIPDNFNSIESITNYIESSISN